IGLAGIVLGWNSNLRVVLPLAAALLLGGVLLIILDWAGLINRRVRAALVTVVICCYVLFLIILGACGVMSAILGAPWPLRQVISNFLVPSRPPATAARKPACEAAQKILAKLDSVTLPNEQSRQWSEKNAFNSLTLIGQLDL